MFALKHDIFLITALKKCGFGETYIKWIQILLRNQESCMINGGTTTKHFKLQKGKETQFLLIYLSLFLKLPLFS